MQGQHGFSHLETLHIEEVLSYGLLFGSKGALVYKFYLCACVGGLASSQVEAFCSLAIAGKVSISDVVGWRGIVADNILVMCVLC